MRQRVSSPTQLLYFLFFMETRAGTTLGRYQVLAEIGRGAMGMVYQALDPEIDRLVAIKTFSSLDPSSAEASEFRERFVQEARAGGRLSHPGIVAIYDRGEEAETKSPYIVMEYVAGQPLSTLLNNQTVRLEEQFALEVAREVADALAYAHEKGVIHRDIKPSNILITEDGHAKIADFGVARVDMSNITSHGEVLGTPAYMSPEQLTGGDVDGRTDIFSLGVILYTMLSGFRPFQGNGASTIGFKVINQTPVPITSYHLDLSKDTEYIVARAMAKNPDERYAGAGLMAADLTDILEGHEPRSRHENTRPVNPDVIRVERDYRPFIAAVMPRETGNGRKRTGTGTGTKSAPVSLVLADAHASQNLGRSRRSFGQLAIVVGALSVAALAGTWIHSAQSKALRAADLKLGMPPVVREHFAATPTPKKVRYPRMSRVSKAPQSTGREVVSKDAESDLDHTVVHVEKPAAAAVAVKALQTTAAPGKPAASDAHPATLDLALQHHFKAAVVSVWVDDKLSFSGISRGEPKKRLFVMRGGVEGRELHQVHFPAGEHEIRVRVVAPDGNYDNSGIVHSTFRDTQHSVLEIRCDRQGIELKLANGS